MTNFNFGNYVNIYNDCLIIVLSQDYGNVLIITG